MVVDRGRLLLAAITALMLGGIILSAGGEPAGGDADRARSVSLLQTGMCCSCCRPRRADRRVVPVAAAKFAAPR